LFPELLTTIQRYAFSLIIIDPVYKGLGDRDENRAGDVASLLNEVERLSVTSGAAVAFGAHFAKGNAAGKEAIDRISGSGVFARDPDTILTMTPHQHPGCYVIESSLRNLPGKDPFVVEWEFPLFLLRDDLCVDDLKSNHPSARLNDSDLRSMMEVLDGLYSSAHLEVSQREWFEKCQETLSLGNSTFRRNIDKLVQQKRLERCGKGKYKPISRYRQWVNNS